MQYAPTSYLTLLYIEMRYSKGRLYCKYSTACWCLCPFTGYTGGFCEQILSDPCASNPCFSNGTCMYNSSSGSYTCHCTKGLYVNFVFVNYFDANNESIDSNGSCAKWPTTPKYLCKLILWQGEYHISVLQPLRKTRVLSSPERAGIWGGSRAVKSY